MSAPANPVELIASASEAAKTGKIDEAITSLKRLLDQQPDHELGIGMLASLYAEIGMLDRAESFFEKALSINNSNPLARLHLGATQMQSGKKEQALSTLKPLLEDDKDFLAHFYSGTILADLNKNEKARIMFTTSAQRMPGNHPLQGKLQEQLKAVA